MIYLTFSILVISGIMISHILYDKHFICGIILIALYIFLVQQMRACHEAIDMQKNFVINKTFYKLQSSII